jgi:hypothetical protein
MKATKAWAGAALGFLAPGAGYLIGVAPDGITGTEWLIGALTCVVTSGAVGAAVFSVENKPKAQPADPAVSG